jgi:hypothetical protein
MKYEMIATRTRAVCRWLWLPIAVKMSKFTSQKSTQTAIEGKGLIGLFKKPYLINSGGVRPIAQVIINAKASSCGVNQIPVITPDFCFLTCGVTCCTGVRNWFCGFCVGLKRAERISSV